MLLLGRRSWVAGALLGLACYKPQFGVVIPFVLLASREWRAIGGAALSVAAVTALTLALWGWPVWQAFIDWLPATRTIIIESGGSGWHKVGSAFAAIRMWGGSVTFAYLVQGMVTITAIGVACLAALRGGPHLRAAGTLLAALLGTPYLMDYDLTVMGMAMAFVLADRQRLPAIGWESSLLALCWVAPLIGRAAADQLLLPLNLIAVLALLAIVLRRCNRPRGDAGEAETLAA